jgi:FAD/FMN-containing dehydrogenase
VHEALAPYRAGQYLNFAEGATDVRDAYAEGTYARLQAAKASYDPQGRFHANHEIA